MQPNLAFSGNAEEVLDYYRGAIGGDVEIVRFGDTPVADQVPSEWGGKVMWGSLRSALGVVNVMDAPPGREPKPGGNISITLHPQSEALAEAIFSKLAEGGEVIMPMAKTFWSTKFGMVTDRYGIRWLVNFQ